VATVGSTASTSRGSAIIVFNFGGGRCRTLPLAPPRGLAIDVFNFRGGRCRICRQHPQGVCHRHLQLRWWPLPDLAASTPRGLTIDVFNFGGGRCRICRQHLPGGPPSTSPTSEPPAPTSPEGPPSMFLSVDGGRARTSCSDTSRGPPLTAEYKDKITEWGAKKLAPSAGSQPLPRWAWGPLSTP
jgi:hypothetical protein